MYWLRRWIINSKTNQGIRQFLISSLSLFPLNCSGYFRYLRFLWFLFIIPYVIIILCLCLYVPLKTYRHHFLSISYHSSKATLRDYRISSKTEHISGAILWSFTQFVFIVCQVEGYRSILELTCKSLAFTSYIPL